MQTSSDIPVVHELDGTEESCGHGPRGGAAVRVASLAIQGGASADHVVAGEIVSRDGADVESLTRIMVSLRRQSPPGGIPSLIGTVEFGPPFEMPLTFALPCGTPWDSHNPADDLASIGVHITVEHR